jgi:hypothetical protein
MEGQMVRRWTGGALTAVIVAIVVATSVSNGPACSLKLGLSPLTIEVSAPTQTARIVFTF